MSKLHTLPAVTKKSSKRLGRGYGSGVGGHTVGRGSKGQHARNSVPLWFEGGQLPLIKRLPMLRGKGRLNPLHVVETVTLSQLEKLGQPDITMEVLHAEGMIARRTKRAKIVAVGTLTKKISVQGVQVSGTARQAIEQAGGSVK